jgi:hypothetical protein
LILRFFIGKIPRFFPGFIEFARIVRALRGHKPENFGLFRGMLLEEVERPEQNKRALVIFGQGGSLHDAIGLSIAND